MSRKDGSLYSKKPQQFETGFQSYNQKMFDKNKGEPRYPVFIGTPCTGLVRMEWAQARFCQVIPCNWSYNSAIIWVDASAPMGYLVADAQNIIVKRFLEGNAEWLFLLEQDNILPPHTFLLLNSYMRHKKVPIVSALYFTKTFPAEPMVYRGRGNSYHYDWKLGDKIWVDAVPTGCLLIHRSIIEEVWKDSPDYKAGLIQTRRVFHTPEHAWFDPSQGSNLSVGTSDMEFCSRLIHDKIFERAGWKKYQKMEYPFLIDTNIFTPHIDNDGRIYPSDHEREAWTKVGGPDYLRLPKQEKKCQKNKKTR